MKVKTNYKKTSLSVHVNPAKKVDYLLMIYIGAIFIHRAVSVNIVRGCWNFSMTNRRIHHLHTLHRLRLRTRSIRRLVSLLHPRRFLVRPVRPGTPHHLQPACQDQSTVGCKALIPHHHTNHLLRLEILSHFRRFTLSQVHFFPTLRISPRLSSMPLLIHFCSFVVVAIKLKCLYSMILMLFANVSFLSWQSFHCLFYDLLNIRRGLMLY